MKMEAQSANIISLIVGLWAFDRHAKAANSTVLSQIWPNFELIRDIIVVLLTCKNEAIPIKNDDTRIITALYIDFSDAQGQLTP